MELVNELKEISLFTMMDHGDLKKIAKICQVHQFADGEVITREGEHDGRLFVVVSGHVRVFKDLGGPHERQVASMGPRSYFGERALIDDFRRTASVQADGPVTAISLRDWNFREYIKRYPSLAMELLQNLARRLRDSEAKAG
ncbi:MAG: cyclic nucleotide-binding domain-containing protein [Desulfarculus sp.]|nr:cyclic nucleotide-binding domain-containing protein [Desulfarculus sp.]